MNKANYLKFLLPLLYVLFCPITITLFWTFLSDQVIESETEVIEEIRF